MRFSLSDMLWTVGLLGMTCAGIGLWVRLAIQETPPDIFASTDWHDRIAVVTLAQIPVSLCAGLAAPFRRKVLGGLLGLSFVIGLLVFHR